MHRSLCFHLSSRGLRFISNAQSCPYSSDSRPSPDSRLFASQVQKKTANYGKFEAGNKLDMEQFAEVLHGRKDGMSGKDILESLFTRLAPPSD